MKIEALREISEQSVARIRWSSDAPSGWPLYRVQGAVVMATRVWVASDAFQAVRAAYDDLWHAGEW